MNAIEGYSVDWDEWWATQPSEAMSVWARDAESGKTWDPFISLSGSAIVCVTPGKASVKKG